MNILTEILVVGNKFPKNINWKILIRDEKIQDKLFKILSASGYVWNDGKSMWPIPLFILRPPYLLIWDKRNKGVTWSHYNFDGLENFVLIK